MIAKNQAFIDYLKNHNNEVYGKLNIKINVALKKVIASGDIGLLGEILKISNIKFQLIFIESLLILALNNDQEITANILLENYFIHTPNLNDLWYRLINKIEENEKLHLFLKINEQFNFKIRDDFEAIFLNEFYFLFECKLDFLSKNFNEALNFISGELILKAVPLAFEKNQYHFLNSILLLREDVFAENFDSLIEEILKLIKKYNNTLSSSNLSLADSRNLETFVSNLFKNINFSTYMEQYVEPDSNSQNSLKIKDSPMKSLIEICYITFRNFRKKSVSSFHEEESDATQSSILGKRQNINLTTKFDSLKKPKY